MKDKIREGFEKRQKELGWNAGFERGPRGDYHDVYLQRYWENWYHGAMFMRSGIMEQLTEEYLDARAELHRRKHSRGCMGKT